MPSSVTSTDSVASFDSTNEHILTIDLNSLATDPSIHAAKRTTTSKLHPELKYQRENVRIVASTLYSAGNEDENVRVIIGSGPNDPNTESHRHWVHLQTEGISFEEFEVYLAPSVNFLLLTRAQRLALNCTLEHHDTLLPVVVYLLRKVQESYEVCSAYGSYIEPGTVVRCDGTDRRHPDRPDLSAIFISLPYFGMAKWSPPAAPADDLHVPRGLFQCAYPAENALDRDADQIFRKFKNVASDQYLRVPQLWLLLFNSETVITCGPSSFAAMFNENFELVREESVSTNGPSLVQVTDFQRRVTYIPIDQCKTFLALLRSIDKECLSKLGLEMKDCKLHVGQNDEELNAYSWPKLLNAQKSVFIYIRISRKQSEIASRAPLALEPPRQTPLIEYGGLSSDESEDDPDKADSNYALMRIRPREAIPRVTPDSDPTRKLQETASRLESQGYIVNDMKSLRDDSVKTEEIEKPKVFLRSAKVHGSVTETSQALITRTGAHDQPQSSVPAQRALVDVVTEGDPLEHVLIPPVVDHVQNESAPAPQHSSPRFQSPHTGGDHGNSFDLTGSHSWGQTEISRRFSDGESGPFPPPSTGNSSPDRTVRFARAANRQPTVESDSENEGRGVDGAHQSVTNSSEGQSPVPDKTNDGGALALGPHEAARGTIDVLDPTRESKRESGGPAYSDVKQAIEAGFATLKDQLESDFQKRVEQELRTRLDQLGFAPSQVEQMLQPNNARPIPAPPQRLSPPTYVKIRREHLSVETLSHYDMPYEIDRTDPDYFIILRELDNRETEILFEHTRRLRSRTLSRSRSKRGRSTTKSFTTNLSEQKQPVAESGEKVDRSTQRRDESPPPVLRQISVDLRVPPFLAWPDSWDPKTAKQSVKHAGGAAHPSSPSEQVDTLTQLTLAAIEKHIYKAKREDAGLPENSRHPFVTLYRTGNAFTQIPTQGIAVLESLPVLGVAGEASDSNSQFLDVQNELEFLRTLDEEAMVHHTEKISGAPSKYPIDAKTKSPSHPGRRVAQWQVARLLALRDSFLSNAQHLIDQFVPKHYPHPLLEKCWGSLNEINNVIADVCQKNGVFQGKELDKSSSLIYLVKPVPDEEYLRMHQLQKPSFPLQSCTLCAKSRQYPDIDDAYQHLRQSHFQGTRNEDEENQKAMLRHWIVSLAGEEVERKNSEMIDLIRILDQRTRKLLHRTIELRNSVANEDNDKPGHYLLPSALVRAAEKTFRFLYTAQHAVHFLDRSFTAESDVSPLDIRDNKALAEHYGIAAGHALSKAQDELLLMAHTGLSLNTTIVHHRALTLQTTVTSTLYSLVNRGLRESLNVTELYRAHLSSLHYVAGHRPSKRILRELYLVDEEIEIIRSISAQQRDTFKRLGFVLDPESYRITDQVRAAALDSLESLWLKNYLGSLDVTESELKKLRDQISKTAQVLRYNIEIAEEGHSTAILTFTLVTIIFLPLSFVASLLGMNTSDMRNMAKTQTLFWEIALPLTAVVGVCSLLVAYKGSEMGDQIYDVLQSIRDARQRMAGRSRASLTIKRVKLEDEEGVGGTETNLLPKTETPRRGQKRGVHFTTENKQNSREEERTIVVNDDDRGPRPYRRQSPITRERVVIKDDYIPRRRESRRPDSSDNGRVVITESRR